VTQEHARTWAVVREPVSALARDSSGVPVVARSEWVRVFLGRAISFANVLDGEGGAEYLVSGTDVFPPDGARAGIARDAIDADFASLKVLVAQHRELVEKSGSASDAAILTRAYATLRRVTVPSDPADWRCTDEGLCIVRWGLEGVGRPLLSWTEEELDRQHRELLERHPVLRQQAAPRREPRLPGPAAVAASIAADQANKVSVLARVAPSTGAQNAPPQPQAARPSASAPSNKPVTRPTQPAHVKSKRDGSLHPELLRSPAAWGVAATIFALGALLGVLVARFMR
jgi:hypothetical protein